MCALAFRRQTHVDDEVWTLFCFTWIVELQHLLPLWLIWPLRIMNVFILIQGALP
jgi:hypothetical protein